MKRICFYLAIVFVLAFINVSGVASYDVSVALSKDMPQEKILPGQNTLMKFELINAKNVVSITFFFLIKEASLQSLTIENMSLIDEIGRTRQVEIAPMSPLPAGIGYYNEFIVGWGDFKSGAHQITLQGYVKVKDTTIPILLTTKLIRVLAVGIGENLSVEGKNLPLTAQIGQTGAIHTRQNPVFQIKQQEIKQGESVSIFAQDQEGEGISAFDIVLSFKGGSISQLIEPLAGWYIESSLSQDRKNLRVIGVGVPPISQECRLFKLAFNAPGTVEINFTKAEINGSPAEGGEDVLLQNQTKGGVVRITAVLLIEAFLNEGGEKQIYPNPQDANPVLKMGKSLFLKVKGGTPPYEWLESLANISSDTTVGKGLSWPTRLEPLGDPNPDLFWAGVFLRPLPLWMMEGRDPYSSDDFYFVKLKLTVKDSNNLTRSLVVDIFPTYGDLDGDGKVEAADAVKLLNFLSSPPWPVWPAPLKYAADVNGNKIVSAIDALLILQYAVGIIHSLPVENPVEAAAPSSSKAKSLFNDAIEQLKESKKVDSEAIELLLRVREQELAKWGKTIPTAWGFIKK